MSTEATLLERCGAKCELCGAEHSLSPFIVAPHSQVTVDHAVMICDTCKSQVENSDNLDMNHWRCLNDSMWSQEPAVQVVVWRQLKRIAEQETWARDLLDMMYMDEDTQKWAEIGMDDDQEKTVDVNGAELKKGDDVTVIKDLPVKGSSQIIKQGTVVRGISLDNDPKLISGKVNGQSMYLIAAYCRKK